jgi:methyl-accepting chemotaxis protein
MIVKLFDFLEINSETKASASLLSDLLTPRVNDVIEQFYNRIQNFEISPHITDQLIPTLKEKHRQHWIALFNSEFREEYFANVRRIAMRHRDIELNPMWYVAGYMRLKLSFVEVIVGSDYPAATKETLVKTLDKYIAIDMALALSTYDAVILD